MRVITQGKHMMLAKRLAMPLLLVLLAMWASPTLCVAADTSADANAADVESVLVRFGGALASGDFGTVRLLAAPDFALLEEGRTYDRAGTIASARSVLSTGTLTRKSSQFHTRIRGHVAWSHYRVTGQFRGSGSPPVAIDLIESAVLERSGSGWRLVLLATMPYVSTPQAQQ
jgi:hypothetical protein